MSRFLRLLVLFLLPLLLLALAAEVYVWHLPNSYRIKRAAMTRMADSVEVIILGNSHAFFGLRPDLMSKPTLNLANVSQTLDYDLLLLADYQPRCPRLRRVYLVVDHSNFFDPPMAQGVESFRTTYYDRYMGIRPKEMWHFCPLEITHFESFKAKLTRGLDAPSPDCDIRGWGTGYTVEQRPPGTCTDEEAQRVSAKHTCKDSTQYGVNHGSLHGIADYCFRHGLQLVFVATPVLPAYTRLIPAAQRQCLAHTYAIYRDHYSVAVADFSSDSRFAGNDFFDTDHLTDTGAAKLTRLLDDTVFIFQPIVGYPR